MIYYWHLWLFSEMWLRLFITERIFFECWTELDHSSFQVDFSVSNWNIEESEERTIFLVNPCYSFIRFIHKMKDWESKLIRNSIITKGKLLKKLNIIFKLHWRCFMKMIFIFSVFCFGFLISIFGMICRNFSLLLIELIMFVFSFSIRVDKRKFEIHQ